MHKEITEAERRNALENAVSIVRKNLPVYTYKCQDANSVNGIYPAIDNIEWTTGFWPGELWLSYLTTDDELFAHAAGIFTESFRDRIKKHIMVDHHDMGFLYTPSCVAAWQIKKDAHAREAAILAARAGKTMIGNLELYEAINKVIMGPQKKSRVVTEADKRSTAYHESGHAILAKLCENCDNVQEVSIIPRGMAAGYTLSRPETDDRTDTVNKLNDEICMALGGRVAEELVIHDYSAGAAGDIRQITNMARRMVTEWGMSARLGPVSYGNSGPVFLGRDYEERNLYSEATAALIDEEIKRIIETQYERAKKLLREHRSVLDNMARVLVERETIYTSEVDMLMKGASYEEVLRYMEEHDKGTPDRPFGSAAVPEQMKALGATMSEGKPENPAPASETQGTSGDPDEGTMSEVGTEQTKKADETPDGEGKSPDGTDAEG